VGVESEMKLDNRVHNHPILEREKGLDENHVIIDKELYLELLAEVGDKFTLTGKGKK